MIGANTRPLVACCVVGCKVTGREPEIAGRTFVCTKHLGEACTSQALTAHAHRAAALKAILARKRIHPGHADLLRSEIREANAWRVLMTQVRAKFEVRA